MNIHDELLVLYQDARGNNQLDLAFKIMACLAKLKPNSVCISALSDDDIATLIDQCE